MSKVAAVVCEGPTDFPILEELILTLWPEVERVLPLQPPLDALGKPTSKRRGWSEVKKWCEENAAHLPELLSDDFGDPIDLLVVALDVDIAIQADVMNPPKQGVMHLAEKGKLALNDDGRPTKPISAYGRFAKQVGRSLAKVRKKCPEADRLCKKIEQRRDATKS